MQISNTKTSQSRINTGLHVINVIPRIAAWFLEYGNILMLARERLTKAQAINERYITNHLTFT